MKKIWTEEQTKLAQAEIKKIVDKINNTKVNGKDLSPFEKFLIAYNYVSDFAYNQEQANEDPWFSRDLEGIYNTGRIVCEGYAQLLSTICDGIGITCLKQGVLIEEHNNGDELITGGVGHANNLVILDDEKYGISGAFYVDACWDALIKYYPYLEGNPNPNYKKYCWCLIPYDDPKNYNSISVIIKYEMRGEYTGLTGIPDVKENTIRLKNYLGISDKELEILIRTNKFGDMIEPTEEYVKNRIASSKPITAENFYKALIVIEQARGLSYEEAANSARQTMRYNAFMSQMYFNNEKCNNCFSKLQIANSEFDLYENTDDISDFKIK